MKLVKKLLMPTAMLTLLAIDLMAFDAIDSKDDGFMLYGYFILMFSVVFYSIMALIYLSKLNNK